MRFGFGQTILAKFLRLPWADRLLVIEATYRLVVAALALAAFPFRRIGLLASSRINKGEPASDERALIIRRVRWAVVACARRLPIRAKCFEQGLAVQRMLRRRGVASTLYFGAAPDDEKKLAAHVWVRDGDVDVIGCEISKNFAVLAQFPSHDA